MSNTSNAKTAKTAKKTDEDKVRVIVGEIGRDTKTGILGRGYSYDNGKTFHVTDTMYGRLYGTDDIDAIWSNGTADKVKQEVNSATAEIPSIESTANEAVSRADSAIAASKVNSDAQIAMNSAIDEAKTTADSAASRALSAWDVATGAKEAVTDFDPLLKSAQSDAGKALTQIADTASALSDAKTAFGSDVAEAKELANTAQTTANSAVESASENARELASQANALSDTKKAIDSDVASAKGLANSAQSTADSAIKSAASVASDLTAVASQANSNTSGITKVTSDVGLLQTTVADNSGDISKIQETAAQIQQAVSDNSGAIMTATQTADSAVAVASDAKSNATVAVQTASGASVTAGNAQSDATTAMVTANGAVTQASDAKSNATIAVQTASEASVTATNAQGDASIAKQTASDASVQIKNAQGDISNLQTRAGKIEASVATNSGAIADVQATANELKASVADNSGNITTAKQTADSAATVASDAHSNATVAIQTASQASITANNASGQAASAVLTANGAMTTASNAKSDATVAIQTASGASLTATNAQSDATVAKQTASEAIVQASNADSDFAQLSIRANKIEANVADNSGAIASVQQTASGLTTTVAELNARDGVNLLQGTSTKDNVGPSDFSNIPVTAGDSYTFSGTMSSPSTSGIIAPYIQFYDGSGTKLKEFDKNSNVPVANGTSFAITGVAPTNAVTAHVLLVKSDGSITINYGSLKFEHGSQATPWTPAPTDASVAYNSLKFTVDQTSNIINDPKTGLNATYQTATGNASTISNVKGDVSQLQTTANGLTSRVGNLESKTDKQQTAIEQNKTDITLKADQTTVNTLKGTVDQNTATLKTQSGQIQAKVSASDVTGMLNGYATQNYAQSLVTQTADKWNLNLTSLQTDVNAIKTTGGGVNLLQGTRDFSGMGIPADKKVAVTNGGEQFQAAFDTQVPGQSVFDLVVFASVPLEKDTDYTASFWIKTSEDTDITSYLFDSGSNGVYADGATVNHSTTDYTRVVVHFHNGNNNATPNFIPARIQKAGVTVWVYGCMLEEGTVAHTWSPAPSDMATVTSVANLSATVNGIQSQVYNSDGSSKITQLSGLIQSKVGTDDFNNLKQAVDLQTLDSADINNMKTNGHYFVHNLANNPIGGWVYVDVTGDGSTRIRQDVYQDNGTKHQYRRWVDTNWTDWEEGATYTEINQLKDAINLRVKSGDLLSQINLTAHNTLIQSNKIYLDSSSTVFSGKAFIPSAAIVNLDVAKLNAGTINTDRIHIGDDSVYLSVENNYLRLDGSNTKDKYQLRLTGNDIEFADNDSSNWEYRIQHGIAKYQTDEDGLDFDVYSKRGGANHTVMAVSDAGVMISPSLFFQTDGIDSSNWMGFTRNTVDGNSSVSFHTWDDNNEGFHVDCGARFMNYVYINGYARAQGWLTNSTLSKKTNIRKLDLQTALDKIRQDDQYLYEYKRNVAKGIHDPQASFIIDDIHDVAQYSVPREFIDQSGEYREPNVELAYLVAAFQALDKQVQSQQAEIKKLKEQLSND